MTRPAPSQEEVRRRNLGALLRHVHVHGATSRAELTGALGLNRSTIGALVADLGAAGLVTEQPPDAPRGAGRPSLVVRPESAVHAYAMCIEVDRLRAARVGLGGRVLDRREAARPRGTQAVDAVDQLAGFLRELRRAAPPGARTVGGGLAVTGMVRRADGVVRLAPAVGWVDEPVGAALRDRLGGDHALAVANVADVVAAVEHTRGAAAGSDNVLYLHGDVGVGAGLIAGGRTVTGHGGYGGQVGHMVVDPHGRPCPCGGRGCWETEVGEQALLRLAGRTGASGRAAVLDVVAAAARGDTAAQHAVRTVGDRLGFGAGNLVNVLNPETVVFGGTLRDVYLAAAAQVRSRLATVALPALREHLRLRTPGLGDDAALVGAAELAFERLLADPLG